MITSYIFIAMALLVILTLRSSIEAKYKVAVSIFWPIAIPLMILILVLYKLGVAVGFNVRPDKKFGVEFYVYRVS